MEDVDPESLKLLESLVDKDANKKDELKNKLQEYNIPLENLDNLSGASLETLLSLLNGSTPNMNDPHIGEILRLIQSGEEGGLDPNHLGNIEAIKGMLKDKGIENVDGLDNLTTNTHQGILDNSATLDDYEIAQQMLEEDLYPGKNKKPISTNNKKQQSKPNTDALLEQLGIKTAPVQNENMGGNKNKPTKEPQKAPQNGKKDKNDSALSNLGLVSIPTSEDYTKNDYKKSGTLNNAPENYTVSTPVLNATPGQKLDVNAVMSLSPEEMEILIKNLNLENLTPEQKQKLTPEMLKMIMDIKAK